MTVYFMLILILFEVIVTKNRIQPHFIGLDPVRSEQDDSNHIRSEEFHDSVTTNIILPRRAGPNTIVIEQVECIGTNRIEAGHNQSLLFLRVIGQQVQL